MLPASDQWQRHAERAALFKQNKAFKDGKFDVKIKRTGSSFMLIRCREQMCTGPQFNVSFPVLQIQRQRFKPAVPLKESRPATARLSEKTPAMKSFSRNR